MICTTIQNRTREEIESLLLGGDIEMAEIRLDRCPLSDEDIEELFSSSDVPLVATCRMSEAGPAAPEKLAAAIRAGARFADLEIEAPAPVGRGIRELCTENGTVLIRSFHDFSGTPTVRELRTVAEKCRRCGADIVKIVTTALKPADAFNVLSLYDLLPRKKTLIAFAMGEEGRHTRTECLRAGAPFSYASLNEDEAAAPGQIPAGEMREAVYPGMRFISCASPLRMPASKSYAQRAIIAAALADGTSRITGYSSCGDNDAAVAAARALGAKVTRNKDILTIEGIAAGPGTLRLGSLDVGESGLLTRMLIPLLSVLNDGPVEITGRKTLLNRNLSGVSEAMAACGVSLHSSDPEACRVPLTVDGTLLSGRFEIDGSRGSQLVSGLLMALPFCEGESVLRVTAPKSLPYLFITMEVLRSFGIEITSRMEGDEELLENGDWSGCSCIEFTVGGAERYRPAVFAIEGDWSGAANFLVAGAVFGSVDVSGLDMKSLQADISIMDILMEAGAGLTVSDDGNGDETVVHVQRAPLRAFEADAGNCPDLFPITAVLAAFCPGKSRIRGIDRLANKESDRGGAILGMLRKMGVYAETEGNDLLVGGMSLTQRIMTGRLLRGGKFTSFGDHRMAMALKVASLGTEDEIRIDDTDCMEKSFPTFSELFDGLERVEPYEHNKR